MQTAAVPQRALSDADRDHLGPEPQPVDEGERIVSIDVLRGVAILGILPMNIQYFSMIGAAYSNPTAYGDLHGANYLVWVLSHLLADGKFITVFSMLFGAGILLMTKRIEAGGRSATSLHCRRMGWLILFGAAHAYLLWSGDILFAYGISGLVVYLCRRLRPRTLVLAGLLAMAVTSAYLLTCYDLWSHVLSPAQFQTVRELYWKPTPSMVAEEIQVYRGTWVEQMKYRAPASLEQQTGFFITLTFWRVAGLMLIGMALFELGVFSGRQPRSRYWMMVGGALFIGIPVTLYGIHRDFTSAWDFHDSVSYGSQFNYWASLVVSLGWIGAVMLAHQTARLLPLTRRFAAVGRMAFTNYIMQSLLCTTIFYGHGLGLFGKAERTGQFAIVLVIWAVQLILSPIWLRYFLFGPLEWVWRSLTYLECKPFLRCPQLARSVLSR